MYTQVNAYLHRVGIVNDVGSCLLQLWMSEKDSVIDFLELFSLHHSPVVSRDVPFLVFDLTFAVTLSKTEFCLCLSENCLLLDIS